MDGIEVFYHNCTDTATPCPYQDPAIAEFECEVGFYWKSRQVALPPVGPFETEAEALADANLY